MKGKLLPGNDDQEKKKEGERERQIEIGGGKEGMTNALARTRVWV